MDREAVIRMAREACDQAPREDWNSTAWVFGDETLERFATLVAEHEREACAKVVEDYCGAWNDEGYALAAAIRAMGNEKRERDHHE